MIDREKTEFQKRAVRLIKLLGQDCQRQTVVAIQQNGKAATTEDIVRLSDSGILDHGYYISSYRTEEDSLGTLDSLGQHRRRTNNLPCRSDSSF